MKKFLSLLFVLQLVISCSSGGSSSGDDGNTGGSDDVSVTGVSLSKSSITITDGVFNSSDGTYTLTATVMPDNATNSNITWSSDNESVATVSGGVITGIAAGEATITVKTADGGYVDTCDVTVTVSEDSYESNDEFDYAVTLSATDQQGISVQSFSTGDDEDWYKFSNVGSSLGISILAGKVGDNSKLDVNIYLYDSSKNLVASATSNNETYNYSYNVAYLEYKPSSTGTYYLRVISRSGDAGYYCLYRSTFGFF